MLREVENILKENERRLARIRAPFNPYTGEGSCGERTLLELPDYRIPVQYIPTEMMENALVQMCARCGSLRAVVEEIYRGMYNGQCTMYNGAAGESEEGRVKSEEWRVKSEEGRVKSEEGRVKSEEAWRTIELTEEEMEMEIGKISRRLTRIRWYYDFPFWAASMAKIKNKGGGDDVPFVLNRPQRTALIPAFEVDRIQHRPIRVIIDKTRQWGCSTATEMYFGWLQLVREIGLNSLIVGHVSATSAEVEDMYKTLLNQYPVEALMKEGEECNENDVKWIGVGGKQNIHRVPQRNCKIKLGSAIAPENSRGGDYNLVHLTEVGLWMTAEGHDPAAIVQGATGGMLYADNTAIVLESTAKGVGNYFHREFTDAAEGRSQFKHVFVGWQDVDQNSIPFRDEWSRNEFAERLYMNRNNAAVEDSRHEPGTYIWWLWEQGATLEAINWYIIERSKYGSSAPMREEYPTTWQESFVNSGANVFDNILVDKLRRTCKPARWRGELEGSVPLGGEGYTNGSWMDRRGIGSKRLLEGLKFIEDSQGGLEVWSMPEADDEDEIVKDRYLVVVDIGGRGAKADWSVICVIDRLDMMEAGKPCVVAQWVGHIDMDLLAWKSAQIAHWYNDALLVIESNTLETKDRDRIVDGEQVQFILLQIKDVYPNLYYREQSEEKIAEGAPTQYGFHTNTGTKPIIISTLVKVVREQAYVERDANTCDEFCFYERKQNGSFGAVSGKHDDRLMTRAIGLYICFYKMPPPEIVKRIQRKVSKAKVVKRVE